MSLPGSLLLSGLGIERQPAGTLRGAPMGRRAPGLRDRRDGPSGWPVDLGVDTGVGESTSDL